MIGGRIAVIVNPMSRGGRTARNWPRLVDRIVPPLERAYGSVAVHMTCGPGDATRLASEAVKAGAEAVIAAGGDGTVGETLNGLVIDGISRARLGILPLGTGSDLARALGTRGDIDAAVGAIARGATRCVDIGSVTVEGKRRYFLNESTLGLSGEVVFNISQLSSRSSASYTTTTLRSIARWSDKPVTILVDGEEAHSGPLVFAAIANGQFFGGGMRVAPLASVSDGLFDVICVRGTSRWKLIRSLPRLFKGTHLDLPGVSMTRGTEIEAHSDTRVCVEADGETLGALPATFRMHRSAIDLLGIV